MYNFLTANSNGLFVIVSVAGLCFVVYVYDSIPDL